MVGEDRLIQVRNVAKGNVQKVYGKRTRRILSGAWLLVATLSWVTSTFAQSISVPLEPSKWVVSQKNFAGQQREFEGNGQIVNYQGREALRLGKGFAYARDLMFQDGTVEVDMAADPQGAFLGVAFRVQSEDDYELFFFRPAQSGTPDAIQYTPGLMGGNVWQLFSGPAYTAAADIPREKWIHVRIVVSGSRASLFLNDAQAPSLTVNDLRLGKERGSIGFWGRGGGGYFSNLSYTPAGQAAPYQLERDAPAGALMNWEISQMLDPGKVDPGRYPDVRSLKWEKVEAESPGMVVINRYRPASNAGNPPREQRLRGLVAGSRFVFARTTIHSNRDEVHRMNLGYSDEIVVYLNGKPLFAGNNIQGFRQPEFLGLLDPEVETVYLPLRKGDNELVFAVTDYCCGWAFLGRLDQ